MQQVVLMFKFPLLEYMQEVIDCINQQYMNTMELINCMLLVVYMIQFVKYKLEHQENMKNTTVIQNNQVQFENMIMMVLLLDKLEVSIQDHLDLHRKNKSMVSL